MWQQGLCSIKGHQVAANSSFASQQYPSDGRSCRNLCLFHRPQLSVLLRPPEIDTPLRLIRQPSSACTYDEPEDVSDPPRNRPIRYRAISPF
ncbi:hypothetical protein [Sporisorium scitamineum]|uniref:Uncharacterized protein n=1 Tax=Sporisorium scitamineum TaxID=49012 RepID=A0A0F7RXK5_9BASI|nr:hypothetical protein [Sporisorium scitamineum]